MKIRLSCAVRTFQNDECEPGSYVSISTTQQNASVSPTDVTLAKSTEFTLDMSLPSDVKLFDTVLHFCLFSNVACFPGHGRSSMRVFTYGHKCVDAIHVEFARVCEAFQIIRASDESSLHFTSYRGKFELELRITLEDSAAMALPAPPHALVVKRREAFQLLTDIGVEKRKFPRITVWNDEDEETPTAPQKRIYAPWLMRHLRLVYTITTAIRAGIAVPTESIFWNLKRAAAHTPMFSQEFWTVLERVSVLQYDCSHGPDALRLSETHDQSESLEYQLERMAFMVRFLSSVCTLYSSDAVDVCATSAVAGELLSSSEKAPSSKENNPYKSIIEGDFRYYRSTMKEDDNSVALRRARRDAPDNKLPSLKTIEPTDRFTWTATTWSKDTTAAAVVKPPTPCTILSRLYTSQKRHQRARLTIEGDDFFDYPLNGRDPTIACEDCDSLQEQTFVCAVALQHAGKHFPKLSPRIMQLVSLAQQYDFTSIACMSSTKPTQYVPPGEESDHEGELDVLEEGTVTHDAMEAFLHAVSRDDVPADGVCHLTGVAIPLELEDYWVAHGQRALKVLKGAVSHADAASQLQKLRAGDTLHSKLQLPTLLIESTELTPVRQGRVDVFPGDSERAEQWLELFRGTFEFQNLFNALVPREKLECSDGKRMWNKYFHAVEVTSARLLEKHNEGTWFLIDLKRAFVDRERTRHAPYVRLGVDVQDWLDASGWRDGDDDDDKKKRRTKSTPEDFALVPSSHASPLEPMTEAKQCLYEFAGRFTPPPRKHACVEGKESENVHLYTDEMQKHARDAVRLYVRDIDWEHTKRDFETWCARHEMQFYNVPVKLFKEGKPMHLVFVWLK